MLDVSGATTSSGRSAGQTSQYRFLFSTATQPYTVYYPPATSWSHKIIIGCCVYSYPYCVLLFSLAMTSQPHHLPRNLFWPVRGRPARGPSFGRNATQVSPLRPPFLGRSAMFKTQIALQAPYFQKNKKPCCSIECICTAHTNESPAGGRDYFPFTSSSSLSHSALFRSALYLHFFLQLNKTSPLSSVVKPKKASVIFFATRPISSAVTVYSTRG